MRRIVGLKVLPSDICELDMSWYDMIQAELLKRTVGNVESVLDVGCRRGEVLHALSKQIGRGVGIDISRGDLAKAEARRKKRGIKNVKFKYANALDLPFASGSFDAVLLLGDVFTYSNLAGRHERVLSEIKRVLKKGGLTAYEGMNWDWEYRLSSYWTHFTRTRDGHFRYHRAKRTASGRETEHNYRVKPGTPLHEWALKQKWPVCPQGYDTTLDVAEHKPIPQEWLEFEGVSKNLYYTPRSLKRSYKKTGFREVEVFAYGQTYDIVSKAGVLETVGRSKKKLAKAEAELILQQRVGSGPWLFLSARK